LLMDSFFALVSLLFIVIFNKYIVKNNRLFLILLFSLPFIFLAVSEVLAGNLGISSERIITLNNRSHIWGGLIQYISRMDIVDWLSVMAIMVISTSKRNHIIPMFSERDLAVPVQHTLRSFSYFSIREYSAVYWFFVYWLNSIEG